jgi:catechol-2,3-dioxygenase
MVQFFKQESVAMIAQVKHHRDGVCSFYCRDPDGNAVQIIYRRPLSAAVKGA